jgi:dimethylargininase
MFSRAIVRQPGPDFARGLTTADLGPPSFPLILEQHAAYVAALRGLGLEVTVLDPAPGFPDAYFVEDPAVVTPEVAVISDLGAPSRRGEEATLEPEVSEVRKMDGGLTCLSLRF